MSGLRVGEHESWGTASYPELSTEQFRLDQVLWSVPERGTIVDIGAGIGLSLASAIHVRRPDIAVVNVDPGFSLLGSKQDFVNDLDETVGRFESKEQRLLATSGDWYKLLVAGFAEELPIRDESADMVVSYATIPDNTFNDGQALKESLRILKPGRFAIFGPIQNYIFKYWDTGVKQALAAGAISDYHVRPDTIVDPRGQPIDVRFTFIIK